MTTAATSRRRAVPLPLGSLLLASLLLAPLLLAACRESNGPPPKPDGPQAPAVGALLTWEGFPWDRHPRPVVLLGETATAAGGFVDDAARLAFLDRRLTVTAALPAAPATARVELPDGPAELALIGAAAAVAALSKPVGGSGPAGPPLVLDRVSFAPATFHSDRGPLTLPAWQFSGPGTLGPIAWPAVDPAALWRPGEVRAGPTATVAADDVTLTFALPMPARLACPGSGLVTVHGRSTSTPYGVAIGVGDTGSALPAPPGCTAGGGERPAEYHVVLFEPLGGRIVIGPDGGVVTVLRA
jgi:hypothetical protein